MKLDLSCLILTLCHHHIISAAPTQQIYAAVYELYNIHKAHQF